MANDDRLTTSLQESTLTTLCFDERWGGIISGLVTAELFEDPYRDIAVRVLEFRQRFSKPPGIAHIDDIFDTWLSDPDNQKAPILRQILIGMHRQSEALNGEYVASRITEFVRQQKLKTAVYQAAQELQRGQTGAAEQVLTSALRMEVDDIEPGTFLNDKSRALRFLTREEDESVGTGIEALDHRGLGPNRKELWLFMAPPKRGKTWSMIHLAKMAFRQGWNVAHLSLEMSEDRICQRYFQSLFAVAKRPDEFQRAALTLDPSGRLAGFSFGTAKPELHMQDPKIRQKLGLEMDKWGVSLGRLVVKQFPSGQLTVPMLGSYLDRLEQSKGFTPGLLIVDYPDLMALNRDHVQQDLSRTIVDLRGIAVARNYAVAAPTQLNRAGITAETVTSVHVAADISKVYTADTVVSYNQTKEEKRCGLARLYVSNARNDEDQLTVVITQSYATGQFCLESALMTDHYWDQLKDAVGRPAQQVEEA